MSMARCFVFVPMFEIGYPNALVSAAPIWVAALCSYAEIKGPVYKTRQAVRTR